MQETKELTKSVVGVTGNFVRYVLYFLVLVLTPSIAKPIAKQFDWCALSWSEPGQLRVFFTSLFSVIILGIALAIVFSVENAFKKTVALKTTMLTGKQLKVEAGGQAAAVDAEVAVAQAQSAPLSKEERQQRAKQRREKRKEWWKTNFQSKPILPWRNVGTLLLITSACILLISVQIDFQVKPFYELGDKTTYSEMLNKGSELILNAVKCVWIVMLLRAALGLWESLLEFWEISHVRFLKWVGAGAMLVLFGIYDVCATGNPFAWTYIAFYVAFTAIYYFSERSEVKSYLLTLFIYIF